MALYFCEQCKKDKFPPRCPGFWDLRNDKTFTKCPQCGCNLKSINTYIDNDDLIVMHEISTEKSFIDAMIELKDKDPIEYQSRMAQFRNQSTQQNQVIRGQSNTPKCPTCSSTNIKKISGLSKAGSVAMWGIFSRKIHKQWHCNSCGSEW